MLVLVLVVALATATIAALVLVTSRRDAPTALQMSGATSPVPHLPAWFASDSVWNAPLPQRSRTAADSAAVVDRLALEAEHELQAGNGPWLNTSTFGVAVERVSGNQRTQPVAVANADAALQQQMRHVPMPPAATPAAGTDGHLVIWQPGTDTMWELFRAQRIDGRWTAEYGGVVHRLSESPGYYRTIRSRRTGKLVEERGWGAAATGLPLLGGLITPIDLARGRLDHALALGVPGLARRLVRPATRTDGTSADPSAVPAGARFRLPSNYDVDRSGMTGFGREVARTARDYGLIVRDTSGNLALYGQANVPQRIYDKALGGRSPAQALAGFPWRALELVEPPRG